MAKKPRANNQNATIRNVVIIFSALVIIGATALIWNNRSLSYAGTIDNHRLPVEQFNFIYNGLVDQLWEAGNFNAEADAVDPAWDELVNLHLTVIQASELGVTLTDEDREQIDFLIDWYTDMYTVDTPHGPVNIIHNMGFTNASFRRFVEQMVLQERVFTHLSGNVSVSEDDFQVAFEEFLDEHYFDIKSVMVNYIEVETLSEASSLLARFVTGEDFLDLMRAHSLFYDTDFLPIDEDGNFIEQIDIRMTSVAMDFEQLAMAYAMEVGNISEIIELVNGNFAFFEVTDIEHLEMEMLEDFFRFGDGFQDMGFEGRARADYFNNRLLIWREAANISQNTRIFN